MFAPTGTHASPQFVSMLGRAQNQAKVEQETEPSKEGQLVSITNKTTTVEAGRIFISTDKVPRMVEGTEIVTRKRNKKRERQELAEEASFKHKSSLVDFQQFVQIDQNDTEVSPKFDPVQESSAEPHKMLPSARRLLLPSDGDPNPPPVRGSYVG